MFTLSIANFSQKLNLISDIKFFIKNLFNSLQFHFHLKIYIKMIVNQCFICHTIVAIKRPHKHRVRRRFNLNKKIITSHS